MNPQQAHTDSASPNFGDLAVFGLLAVSFVAYFWDFIFRQCEWAFQQTDDWGHTLVAPLIAGWFLRRAWPQIESSGVRVFWWGLLPLGFGLMFCIITISAGLGWCAVWVGWDCCCWGQAPFAT